MKLTPSEYREYKYLLLKSKCVDMLEKEWNRLIYLERKLKGYENN